MPTLTSTEARAIASRILQRMGAPADVADVVGASLIGANLAGHANHGIAKLLDYRSRVARGALDPAARAVVTQGQSSGSVVAVDGGRGFGHPAAKLLISTMVDRLQSEPVVIGGLSRASHTGRLGEWSEYAMTRGAIALLFSASLDGKEVAASNGSRCPATSNVVTATTPKTASGCLTLSGRIFRS